MKNLGNSDVEIRDYVDVDIRIVCSRRQMVDVILRLLSIGRNLDFDIARIMPAVGIAARGLALVGVDLKTVRGDIPGGKRRAPVESDGLYACRGT